MPCFGKVLAKIYAYFFYLFFKNISNSQFLERNLFLSRSIRNKTIFDNKSVAIGIDVGKNTQEEEEMIKEIVLLKA